LTSESSFSNTLRSYCRHHTVKEWPNTHAHAYEDTHTKNKGKQKVGNKGGKREQRRNEKRRENKQKRGKRKRKGGKRREGQERK